MQLRYFKVETLINNAFNLKWIDDDISYIFDRTKSRMETGHILINNVMISGQLTMGRGCRWKISPDVWPQHNISRISPSLKAAFCSMFANCRCHLTIIHLKNFDPSS